MNRYRYDTDCADLEFPYPFLEDLTLIMSIYGFCIYRSFLDRVIFFSAYIYGGDTCSILKDLVFLANLCDYLNWSSLTSIRVNQNLLEPILTSVLQLKSLIELITSKAYKALVSVSWSFLLLNISSRRSQLSWVHKLIFCYLYVSACLLCLLLSNCFFNTMIDVGIVSKAAHILGKYLTR